MTLQLLVLRHGEARAERRLDSAHEPLAHVRVHGHDELDHLGETKGYSSTCLAVGLANVLAGTRYPPVQEVQTGER